MLLYLGHSALDNRPTSRAERCPLRSNTNYNNKKTRQKKKQYHKKCTYENQDIVNIKIWYPQVKIRKSTLEGTIKFLIMRRFVCVKTVDF